MYGIAFEITMVLKDISSTLAWPFVGKLLSDFKS